MKTKFYLIPCDTNKRPLTRNGEKDASCDPDQIAEWKKIYPNCNWAICTGPSDLIAVDMDMYKASFYVHNLAKLFGHTRLPTTVQWRSGSGGEVFLFKRGGKDIKSRTGVVPAVDIKANTGYVLCPPSTNKNGPYEWVNPPTITETVDAPYELLEFLTRYEKLQKPMHINAEGELYLVAGCGRWEHIRRLGGIMRRVGCGENTLWAALSTFAKEHCESDSTIDDMAIKRIVSWLMRVPPGSTEKEVLNKDEE